jgi:hypothetical protein
MKMNYWNLSRFKLYVRDLYKYLWNKYHIPNCVQSFYKIHNHAWKVDLLCYYSQYRIVPTMDQKLLLYSFEFRYPWPIVVQVHTCFIFNESENWMSIFSYHRLQKCLNFRILSAVMVVHRILFFMFVQSFISKKRECLFLQYQYIYFPLNWRCDDDMTNRERVRMYGCIYIYVGMSTHFNLSFPLML